MLGLQSLKLKRIFVGAVIAASIFLLAGPFFVVSSFDRMVTTRENRMIILAPFFAGFVFMGFLGLLTAYKNSMDQKAVYGLIITLFSFVSIELLCSFVGGV